ncbi:MAG: PTS sugar transporter subunit IIB [Elusimicrobiaceae bacterium]|jgi:mannose/fructose/N-acetylgalactosamine-specific phosphotransferase system component IIB
MAIVFVRIDDRLIHGQVVEGWIPYLDVNEVVVINEDAAQDEIRKTLMRLSLPDEIGLEIMDAKEGALYLNKNASSAKRTLVLLASPEEAVNLIKNGYKPGSINVGGMHYSVGRTQIGRAVFLDDENIKCLKAIAENGVKLEGRGVPSDSARNFLDVFGNK